MGKLKNPERSAKANGLTSQSDNNRQWSPETTKKTGSILKILKSKNNLKLRTMYKLEINGSYKGRFKTPAEAMEKVDKLARPFKHSWKITDRFNKVYAQG